MSNTDAQLNTPVLMIFFNRPDTLEKVFEKVRLAKPKKLYLAQDGARGRQDEKAIYECRNIVENIDWDCEVSRLYSDYNRGCGRMPYDAISWVLENEARTIILEDDCVACETFFPYCQTMLDEYENDKRVAYISGLNHFGEWDCGENSAFFAKTGAIWGWATWRDRWEKNDYYASVIENEYERKLLKDTFDNKDIAGKRMEEWQRAYASKKTGEKLSFWDIQWGLVKYSQNMLVVVPKYNQICNIGVGASSTHAQDMTCNKWIKGKNFVFIPTKNLEIPLKIPKHMICDREYDRCVYKASEKSIIVKIKIKLKKLMFGGRR